MPNVLGFNRRRVSLDLQVGWATAMVEFRATPEAVNMFARRSGNLWQAFTYVER